MTKPNLTVKFPDRSDAIDAHRHKQVESALDRLMVKYGVSQTMRWPQEAQQAQLSIKHALGSISSADGSWLGELKRAAVSNSEMIGRVGTRIFSGRIFTQKNNQYDTFTVRGYTGSAGLYQDYRYSESQIYDAAQSITELGRGVTPVLVPPKHVLMSQKSGIEDWMRQQSMALCNFRCLEQPTGGFREFLGQAHSLAWLGFFVAEPGFKRGRRGGWLWHRAEPRQQNTVDRWHMVGDQLVGIEFRTNTQEWARRPGVRQVRGADTHYILPTFGERAIDNHVILARYGGIGNNWEGMPPTRPSLHWVAFKRLIAQIVASGAEKIGNPIALLQKDPDFLNIVTSGYAADVGDMQKAYNAINDQRATDVPVHWLGNGITVKMVEAGGDSFAGFDWLKYCDQMISFPFSNEGNLIGMDGAGSYNLGEVKERRMLRNGSTFTSRIEDAINAQVIAPLFFDAFPDAPEAPQLKLITPYTGDQGKWVETILKALGPNPPALEEWPKPLQTEFYRRMGIDNPDARVILSDDLTPYLPPSPKPVADDEQAPQAVATEKVADTAFNGAQVTSMVNVVSQVAQGLLPAKSGIAILKKAFLMTQDEAEAVINPAANSGAAKVARQEAQDIEVENE